MHEQSGILINNTEIISRLDATWRIIKRGIPMAASYTFSFDIIVLALLAGHMDNNDNQANLSAATLITTAIQLMVTVSISALFVISMLTSTERGKLKSLSDNSINNNDFNNRESNKIISTMIKNGLVISVITAPIIIIPLYFSETILTKLLHQDPIVSELAGEFLKPYSAVIPAILARTCFEHQMFGFEKQVPEMIMALSTFAVGVCLAYMLCNGTAFFPKLGFAGITIKCHSF